PRPDRAKGLDRKYVPQGHLRRQYGDGEYGWRMAAVGRFPVQGKYHQGTQGRRRSLPQARLRQGDRRLSENSRRTGQRAGDRQRGPQVPVRARVGGYTKRAEAAPRRAGVHTENRVERRGHEDGSVAGAGNFRQDDEQRRQTYRRGSVHGHVFRGQRENQKGSLQRSSHSDRDAARVHQLRASAAAASPAPAPAAAAAAPAKN